MERRRDGHGRYLPLDADIGEWFWAKVDKKGPVHPQLGTRCWIWTGGISKRTGYGQLTIGNHRGVFVHRLSYELCVGPIKGVQIDHRCHNLVCVNPQHLRRVSNKQNQENRAGLNANNTSGMRGVIWDSHRNCWRAEVRHHGRKYWVGRFASLAAADAAVTAKRNELFTHNDLDRAG